MDTTTMTKFLKLALLCLLHFAQINGQSSEHRFNISYHRKESIHRKLSTSPVSFLAQALLLSPPKIEEHHVKRHSIHLSSSFNEKQNNDGGEREDEYRKSNNKKKGKQSGHSKGTQSSRIKSMKTAKELGGDLMERLIQGLIHVDIMLEELKNRLLFTQKSHNSEKSESTKNMKNEKEIENMFLTAFEQGLTFQTEDARTALIEKLKWKLLQEEADRNFVIGVMGTSVTAGHDNWFNESWSVVLGQWLTPVYTASGLKVEVRNHAIGGNRYETSAYCAAATVGQDVDAFFFEFNMIFHGPADAYEIFIRNVLALPSKPVFCQMLGFDAESPDVPARADETGALVKGKPEAIDLVKGLVLGKYRGRRNSGKYLDWKEWVPIESLTDIPQKVTTPYKFTRPPSYWREGRASLFDYYAKFGMHYSDPDGYMREINHLTSFWGVSLNGNKAAPCGNANWHPGPRAHNLRAMILAYHYIEAFGDAIESLIYTLSKQQGGLFQVGGNTLQISAKALEQQLNLQTRPKLPEPMTTALQKLPQNVFPKCALTMSPSMRANSLVNLIVASKTSEGRRVVDRRYGKSIAGLMGWRNWQVVAPPWTVNEIACEKTAGYLDRKWALQGDDSSGWLTLEFDVETDKTPIALCEVACNWGKCPQGRGSLTTDVEVELDEGSKFWVEPMLFDEKRDTGPKSSPLLTMLMKSKVCVEIAQAGGGSVALSRGKHELRLKVKTKDTYVLLSHLIWF